MLTFTDKNNTKLNFRYYILINIYDKYIYNLYTYLFIIHINYIFIYLLYILIIN